MKIIIGIIILFFLTDYREKPVSDTAAVDSEIVSYIVDPGKQDIRFYWKDDNDNVIGSLGNLKKYLKSGKRELVFAMNGGMYRQDQSPQGLYIENDKMLFPPDTLESGYGNFYMQPNGVFFITKEKVARICATKNFISSGNVGYATQSGPMLVVDGEIHGQFKKGSTSLNVRNGVGILPDGKILFAISKGEINFYDFATWFRDQGCKNALYLDGFVSRMYLPDKGYHNLGGKFGVLIGVTTARPAIDGSPFVR
jgi:uncharacterized protein YigE (DUF2233 family)